jgi:putative endonuclease
MTHTELGQHGENLAAEHLRQLGYQIIERNFRFKKTEIDNIALKDETTLIVCEVKTRVTAEIGEPYKAVTRRKQKQIILTADYYVRMKNLLIDIQFDIISIVHNSFRTKIEHIPNAFTPML